MSQNSSSGRGPHATDEDILSVLRTTNDPVLSTAEIADQLPIKRRATLDRLRALEDTGLVESKRIGGRNTVWWLSAAGSGDGAIPADDPFFAEGALFASEDPADEDEIDDIVYGELEG
ncbi:winged helix-turn-helix domain-containing protein [Natrinema sp. 1APR25-10V2]|uniref:winged helix-turn-helix domain-containing protein n=1 Tax=Natrinema sp. 1APR25-10V2 TaxID=2951081 RepID=UPI0028770C3B|nr:winged helix-turn-helix domain-containing protein [Natrinema sp. 1APR25-10V2]MDS0475709.1 winged helix-turn-helix domain-containing protein [Natrinema sp. 1APR25-10V2]